MNDVKRYTTNEAYALLPYGQRVITERDYDDLRTEYIRIINQASELHDEVLAYRHQPQQIDPAAVDIQHCVFIGKNADGSSPIELETTQQGPLVFKEMKAIKMHGWHCVGPMLSDEDKALIGLEMSRMPLTEAQMHRLYVNSSAEENEGLSFLAFARLMRRAEAVHQIERLNPNIIFKEKE